MSALGSKTAVVSLGVACQSAQQINEHVGLLRKLTRDRRLDKRRFPFDWVIADPPTIERSLVDRQCFPTDQAEISTDAAVPSWHNIWFWHDFRSHDDPDRHTVDELFDVTRESYERRWRRFLDLERVERRIFVISNTQNNLVDDDVHMDNRVEYRLGEPEVAGLVARVDELFGDERSEFLLVTYADRPRSPIDVPRVGVQQIEPDASYWEGSDEQWSRALTAYFRK